MSYNQLPKKLGNATVTPIEFSDHTPKQNNFAIKNTTSLQSIKYQVCFAQLFAINRLYLLKPNKCLSMFSYVYTVLLPVLVLGILFSAEDVNGIYSVYKYTICSEFVLIIILTLAASKKKLLKLFRDLDKFDESLNISKDFNVIDSVYMCNFWLLSCFVYSIMEYVYWYFYLSFFIDRTVYCFHITYLAHDCESILFFVLLRNIYIRLRIIKAHVLKMFIVENRTNSCYRGKLNKVEALANNIKLDVSSLHRLYDLLHNCAEQLNSIMCLPMLIILFSAGLTTTAILKMIVSVIQTVTVSSTFGKSTIVYLFCRGLKYTVFVVISCYYSSVTSSQVAIIRTVLHDAVNTLPLDKIERRKVKAFILLTKENEFTYVLGGVIRLNMSLPLSYMSLCTTYLVISIQFSKFFD